MVGEQHQEILNKYDSRYHILIADMLNWLEEKEEQWNLETPLDGYIFVDQIIGHLAKQPYNVEQK